MFKLDKKCSNNSKSNWLIKQKKKTSNPAMANQNKIKSRKFSYSYYVSAIVEKVVQI